MKTLLILWVVSMMNFLSPPEKIAHLTTHPEAMETVDERKARYLEIASAIVNVVWDEDTKPVFSGSKGRAHTAALLVGISFMEGGWRRDVDLGIGKLSRGGGLDSCNMQVRIGKNEKTAEGWTAEEVLADREKCFRTGLRIVRASFLQCRSSPQDDRLAAYATGACVTEVGAKKSRQRIAAGRRAMAFANALWLTAQSKAAEKLPEPAQEPTVTEPAIVSQVDQ